MAPQSADSPTTLQALSWASLIITQPNELNALNTGAWLPFYFLSFTFIALAMATRVSPTYAPQNHLMFLQFCNPKASPVQNFQNVAGELTESHLICVQYNISGGHQASQMESQMTFSL